MHPENMPHEPIPRHMEAEPTFGDLLRLLWGHRVRLVTLFLFFVSVSVIGLVVWRYVIARPVVEGTLTLTFRGMERHEYPSGKTFSIEDIRSPQVLTRARDAAGIKPETADLKTLYVGTEISPVIPPEVQARWRKQDRDAAKREEFFPSEFRIKVKPKSLSTDQKLQFLTALVKAYQDQAKFEQEAALKRVAEFSTLSPADLIKTYDTWDLPTLLRQREASFRQQVESLTKESREFHDPRFGLSFRDIGNDLSTWTSTRLEALTAAVYKGRLVTDRNLMVKRLQQRLDELDVQQKQLDGEAEQSTRLVESLDRSKPLLAGPLTNREGAPLVDTTALERLVRSDYVGPVVKRITELHRQAKEIEAERARVERELAILSKADSTSVKPPAAFDDLVALVTKELSRIVANYSRVLDEYLNATVTTLVTLKEGPRVTREGPSLSTLAAILLVLSAALPFVIILFERAFRER